MSGGACRSLAAGDAAAAIGLCQRAGLTRPWNDPAADFSRALACADAVVLGVERDGGVVGTVMVGWDGHRGWLYYLAVDPDRRQQGLGRVLVTAAEAWLVARGAPKVQLMVRDGNDAVAAFWASLGYAVQPVATHGRWLEHRTA